MLNIGCHLSASKGYAHMAKEAISIGANTFQFFTRNPRGGKAKEVDLNDVEKFLKLSNENNFTKIYPNLKEFNNSLLLLLVIKQIYPLF